MQFVSFGGFHSHRRKHSNLQRSLLRFCNVINPLKNAFHPTAFRELLLSQNRSRIFFDDPANIEHIVDESYRTALKKHYAENPNGPLPLRITLSKEILYGGKYSLQWVSKRGRGTMFRLIISPLQNQASLLIKGRDLAVVWECAQGAGLPKPKAEIENVPPVVTSVVTVTPKLLAKLHVTIPLGEILDLIQKYAR